MYTVTVIARDHLDSPRHLEDIEWRYASRVIEELYRLLSNDARFLIRTLELTFGGYRRGDLFTIRYSAELVVTETLLGHDDIEHAIKVAREAKFDIRNIEGAPHAARIIAEGIRQTINRTALSHQTAATTIGRYVKLFDLRD